VRILYFADVRFPLERANGIQTMETCYALAERGHTVHLIVKPDTQSPARDPFEFYGLPRIGSLIIELANVPRLRSSGYGGQARVTGFLQRVGYMSFSFGRVFGQGRADVVMTRDLGVASALVGMPKTMRPPIVYEAHGYAPDVSAALPDLIATAERPSAGKLQRLGAREERVWKSADGYVTITQGLADELTQRFGARDHLAVIPDGMRMPDGGMTPLPAEPVIAYAGHLYAWKGVDVLLRALAKVPQAKGLIVGGPDKEPDLERLKALANELGVAGRVTFTGHLAPAKVREQLARALVLVLPNPASAISTKFTSPLKLFEYMAAGRAIVASDLPAIREVLRDNEQALLVAPGDPDALATAIERLLDDRALAGRLARAAFAEAPAYTWAKRAEQLEALFSRIRS
jgi:glycosyltransferase involved in cell wall biosynthesis